ncbi:Nucleolar 27S pre-rRNA processing, Urb2/Npa2 [Niveomyces insectorum RCEF 264]|uniref:Nucleolar 27S pre-rRNA processing, Urb2/Npa2 n=1 Tax=Niveomyces insectorum RCEF 264 TaxID=1081102 RepID=A0A162MMV5_9HYPO|nr:Nucleolar 27S pre-rRNA processing, Urb2/Npa2 [Niveomyces insectorum RCEF 264]
MAEAALLKATRALDQSGPETVVSKLTRLWDALAATAAPTGHGRFHAAEEVALRWLLKSMNAAGAAAPEAETLRRWPLTWRIVACLFRRIPLFSLAKSLADRRFVAIVQQTARDLATTATTTTTQKAAAADASTDGRNPRKRKRRQQNDQFDLHALRGVQPSLGAAAALFDALRVLLARLDTDGRPLAASFPSTTPYDRMGAEHIKSLFCTTAAEGMPLLVPLLRICNAAWTTSRAAGEDEPCDDDDDDDDHDDNDRGHGGYASWIATFTALWDLHVQGPTDAFEVAVHLSPFVCSMLGRLLDLPTGQHAVQAAAATMTTSVGAEVRRRWSAGLRRFLTTNVVLPARSAFLNRQDLQTLVAAVGDTSVVVNQNTAAVRASVLFYLALQAPRPLAGGATTAKDNERWLQAVFDTVHVPLLSDTAVTASGPLDSPRCRILADLLDMAAKHGVAPARATLQAICRDCALASNAGGETTKNVTDWRLVASVAHCDADAFLVSRDGEMLLDDVLQRLSTAASAPQTAADYQSAVSFLVALARGFARARNLSGFITRWFTGVKDGDNVLDAAQGVRSVWLGPALRTAVAELVPSSLTKEQLLALLARLVADGPSSLPTETTAAATATAIATAVARLVVFDALSAGIRHEELEDAVQTTMLDAVASVVLPPDLVASGIRAIRWRLVRRTLAWVGAAEVERIWAAVRPALQRMASEKGKKGQGTAASAPKNEETFEAFVCAFSLWMALRFGGPAEEEARAVTWAFFDRFQDALSALVRDNGSKEALFEDVARRIAAYNGAATTSEDAFASTTASVASYLTWMLCGSSRFIDEMVKSSKEPSQFLDGLLAWQSDIVAGDAGAGDAAVADAISAALLANLTTLQNDKVTGNVIERYVQQLEQAARNPQGPLPKAAIVGLLRTPTHLLTRHLRERILSLLLPPKSTSGCPALRSSYPLDELVLILDLLIRVTRERTNSDLHFDRVVSLGEAIQETIGSAPPKTALGILDRFQHVVVAMLKNGAHFSVDQADLSAMHASLQLLLLKAKLLSLKNVAASARVDDTSPQVERAREALATLVWAQLSHYVDDDVEDVAMTGTADESRSDEDVPITLLLAFDAALTNNLQAQLNRQRDFSAILLRMNKTADTLCSRHRKMAWKWKAFLACYAPRDENAGLRRGVRFPGLFVPVESGGGHHNGHATKLQKPDAYVTAASVLVDSDLLRDYLAGITQDDDQGALLAYARDLVAALDNGSIAAVPPSSSSSSSSSAVAQLLALQYVLGRLIALPGVATAKTADGDYDLATVHSQLAQRLPRARSATESRLLAHILRTLLLDDKAATAMGQWNVDTTLSAVALAVGRRDANSDAKSDNTNHHECAAAAYDGACRLVEAVLKRHRLRLEGRFHLLVGALQALLTQLVAGHQAASTAASSRGNKPTSWVPQAKRFSRLLELICEPSAAAVTTMTARRGAQGGSGGSAPAAPLHSATDAAKRSAGQHMYLVLMAYLKLQLDGAVVQHRVREALEPGLFSVLSITPDTTRRLLNDAVDAGGRALFKDLYRRWLQFGKWKGV